MKLRISPYTAGFLQAAGVVAYVLLLEQLTNIDQVGVTGGLAFGLLLFCFSVLLCAALTVTFPISLLMQHKTREAVTVILSMVVSMALLFALWICYLIVFETPIVMTY